MGLRRRLGSYGFLFRRKVWDKRWDWLGALGWEKLFKLTVTCRVIITFQYHSQLPMRYTLSLHFSMNNKMAADLTSAKTSDNLFIAFDR